MCCFRGKGCRGGVGSAAQSRWRSGFFLDCGVRQWAQRSRVDCIFCGVGFGYWNEVKDLLHSSVECVKNRTIKKVRPQTQPPFMYKTIWYDRKITPSTSCDSAQWDPYTNPKTCRSKLPRRKQTSNNKWDVCSWNPTTLTILELPYAAWPSWTSTWHEANWSHDLRNIELPIWKGSLSYATL